MSYVEVKNKGSRYPMENILRGKFEKSSVTVGRIDFINTFPIYNGLDNGLKPPWMKIINGVPSALNLMMEQNLLDISPVSSVAYARNHERWLVLPNLSISCFSKVMSVLLVSRSPLEALSGKKVMLTQSSATATELLKLIFAQRKIKPLYEIGTVQCPEDLLNNAEAALVIGDAALTQKWQDRIPHVYDLGQLWWESTRQPFVFALWAVRKAFAQNNPEMVSSVLSLLLDSKRSGEQNRGQIVMSASKKIGIGIDLCRKYYEQLNYDLDPSHTKSLDTFFSGLNKENLMPNSVTPSFFKTRQKTCAA